MTEGAAQQGSATKFLKMDPLDKARGEFGKLLRARIGEKERELEALRAQFSVIGDKTHRSQVCSVCGRSGHSKRTCPKGRRNEGE